VALKVPVNSLSSHPLLPSSMAQFQSCVAVILEVSNMSSLVFGLLNISLNLALGNVSKVRRSCQQIWKCRREQELHSVVLSVYFLILFPPPLFSFGGRAVFSHRTSVLTLVLKCFVFTKP
jgi:hypothetical protein